jgi:hypothetical protein
VAFFGQVSAAALSGVPGEEGEQSEDVGEVRGRMERRGGVGDDGDEPGNLLVTVW